MQDDFDIGDYLNRKNNNLAIESIFVGTPAGTFVETILGWVGVVRRPLVPEST